MARPNSSRIPDLHEPEPGADPAMVPPDILATDKDALDQATAIPGSQYGIRMSSNAALWALANQRTAFEQHIAYLTARDQRRSQSVRWAKLFVILFGVIAFGGAVLSGQFRITDQEPAAARAVAMPRIADAPVDQPKSQPNPVLPESKVTKPPVAVASRATHVVPPQPRERSAPAPAAIKGQREDVAVRASRWIAEPLEGEALRQALIVDRERTKELNDGELGRQIAQHLD